MLGLIEMHTFIKAALSAALIATGCGPDTANIWDQSFDVSGPIETADGIAYVNRTTDELFVLTTGREGDRASLDIARQNLRANPGVATASFDGSKLLVVDKEDEVLQIIDVENPQNVQEVELSADFDRVAVDPFGEFIVLSFSGADDGNVVARNLNEIGVIDVRSGSPTAVFTTLSTRANSFSFAPPFELDGEAQRVMAVLADNELTVFDLLADNEEDRLREVPLSVSESDIARVPLQTVFDTSSDQKLDVYLRSAEADVSRITVRRAGDGSKKLNLSTDKLTVPTPAAMELVTLSGGATRLVTVSTTTPTVTVVDTISDIGTTFELPMTAPAEFLLPYTTTIEEDGTQREEVRLLAYSRSSQLVVVIRPETIALEGDEPTLGRSVEAIRLEQVPTRIELATGANDQAVVFHQSSGFSLLNLFKNNDVPIQGGALQEVLFDGTFAYVVYRTLPNITVFAGDGHPTNFDLIANGTSVHFTPENEVLLVPHDRINGTFTVLDANDPVPDKATVYENIFISDLFAKEFSDE